MLDRLKFACNCLVGVYYYFYVRVNENYPSIIESLRITVDTSRHV